ncbi:MAG: GNAT family N-acetyltransferase, partial [Bacteroidales bacterium]|nr:GNAT family N-acetyltransferase [Bacteroidales bacterium]
MQTIPINAELFLKIIELSDAKTIFETINSQRTYLRKWLPFVDYTREEEDTVRFIKAVYKDEEKVYVLNYQNDFAGLIGFRGTDNFNRKTEIGYWLSEPFQKKGIVTNAVKALVKYAFTELGINRIEINCAVGNEASSRIPQKLGFKLEGIERDG